MLWLEIKVSIAVFGEVLASPKVETVLLRRRSIQLSLGGVLSSRARRCLTGRGEFSPFISQVNYWRIRKLPALDNPAHCADVGDCRTPRCNRRAPAATGARPQTPGGKPAPA